MGKEKGPAFLLLYMDLQSGLGLVAQSGEGGVGDGDLSQHLAVEIDPGLLQTVHQTGIVQTVDLGGGADTGDPELAEISLAE